MKFWKYAVLLCLGATVMQARAQSVQDAQPQQPPQATAVEVVAPNEARQAVAKDDSTKKVCRREVITGSRFAKQICMTQAEWDGMQAATKEALRDAESKPQNPYTERGG